MTRRPVTSEGHTSTSANHPGGAMNETKWIVCVEWDGLGEVTWTGPAATYTAALRQAFPNISPASFRDFVDINRDGTRYECIAADGSSTLVVEAL